MNVIQTLLTEHIDIWTAADTEKKSGRGRSSANVASVYGIRKLRELILELAVRGKLVPQDAKDEPASELLKRIQAEKNKLIKNGTIKKQKPQALISDDEKPFEIPDGWEWLRLDEISPMSLVDGDWIESKDQDPDGGIRLVQLADIGVGEFKDKSDRFINQETFERLNCTQLLTGDILIARLPSPIGRACIFPDSIQTAITVVDVAILRPLGMFCEEYVVDAINSKTFRDQVEDFGKGATRFRIATGNLKSLLIPMPPLAEQHRIVAKVDELMALCDQLETRHNNTAAAHEKLVSHLLGTLTQSQSAADFSANWQRIAAHFDTLFTTEPSIDALKQTLLQLAVMGKLVPQDPQDEPASELLKRIQTEKNKLIAEGRIKKDKPLAAITDDEKLFDLPPAWEWVRLGNALLKITDGTHHSPPNIDKGEFKYISAKNIKSFGIDLSEITYVTKDVHDEIYGRCDPAFGDVLYIKDGATTGIATINTLNEPFSMLSSVALLKPSVGTDNAFLLKAMTSPFFYAEMRSEMTGVAITRVTLAKLNNAVIPLPPISEQQRIVAKVNELMALCDQLKSRITSANQLQQKLADVLVEQAVT